MSDKIAFLDRDGVVNEKAPEHQYITTWSDFRFKEGVFEALRLLREQDYKVVIITNQRGIARKIMTEESLLDIHRRMCLELKQKGARIDGIFYCPHENGVCQCRKPDIGLFLQAEKHFDVNKKESFMIGDSITDMQAGEQYGVRSYFLPVEKSLRTLIEKILGECKTE